MGYQSKDGDNVTRAPLVELFRLGSTYRWQVVHTDKPQSVAEHSHMVAILTTRICQILGLKPEQFVMHAIFHDAEEAWIGDIATPAKRLMDKTKLPTDRMLGVFAQYYNPKMEIIRKVVKVADDVEALRFLVRYTKTNHGKQVYEKIVTRLDETINSLGLRIEVLENLQNTITQYVQGEGETFADDFI